MICENGGSAGFDGVYPLRYIPKNRALRSCARRAKTRRDFQRDRPKTGGKPPVPPQSAGGMIGMALAG